MDLSSVCLAISCFRNDETVLRLLDRLAPAGVHYASILVVDSLGTGNLPGKLRTREAAQPVTYECAPQNLGSAGNLALRLELAARTNARYVFAINHDGNASCESIAELLRLAETLGPKLGAVYPLRRMASRGGVFDVTGRYRFPFAAVRRRRPPQAALTPVFWSSSNGALYSLTPPRNGLLPYADLWMGYEDLGYGWLLHEHGYKQYTASGVQLDDGYEYQRSQGLWITDKPAWYAYYFARNLILTAKRTHQPLPVQGLALARVLLELGVSATLRKQKRARLSATLHGLRDALRSRAGKWRLP